MQLDRLIAVTTLCALAGCTNALDLWARGHSPHAHRPHGEPSQPEPELDGVCDAERERPDLDCYRIFDDAVQAGAFYEQELEPLMAQQFRQAPRALIAESDPVYGPWYARLRGYITQGWTAFGETTDTGALPEPIVLIIEDAIPNAFAAPALDGAHAPLLVLAQTGLLDVQAPDEQMLAVVFHELEHAVQRHTLTAHREALRAFYTVQPGEPEPLGFEMANDPAVAEPVTRVINLAYEAGQLTDPALLGFPFADPAAYVNIPPRFGNVFDAVLSVAAQEAPDSCMPVADAAAAWKAAVASHMAIEFAELVLDDAAREQVRAASQRYADAAAECTAASPMADELTLDEIAQKLHIDFDERDAELFAANSNAADRARALVARRHQESRTLLDGGLADSARIYTFEERADDRAARVLYAMDLDPAAMARFITRFLPDASRANCRKYLDAGETPPYGALADEHHSPCYRIFHTEQLAARLQSGAL